MARTSRLDSHKRARIAVIVAFITNGIIAGSFAARIPDFKETLELSNSKVGLALFVSSLGILGSLGFAGRIVAKQGSARVGVWATLGLGASLLVVGTLVNLNYYLFVASLLVMGAFLAIQDVAMNTHAITLEKAAQKRYMSSFHAFFSVGALTGGFIGGLFAQAKSPFLVQAVLIFSAITLSSLYYRKHWLPAELDQHEYEEKKKTKRPAIFWALGLLGFACSVGEGSAGDWGGVLARDAFGASPFVATLPFIAFTITMVLGRFSGDKLAEKFGASTLIFSGGMIAGIGLPVGLIFGGIPGVIFGWACLGAGASIVIPMLFSAGGEIAENRFPGKLAPSDGVAMVGGVAYFGFMAGPPIMGFVSDHITLRWAMLVPGILMLAMGLAAKPLINSNK